jgi:hypothetical protein
MPTLKDELAALKIERPPERQARPWVKWLVAIVLLALAGSAAWRYEPASRLKWKPPVTQRALASRPGANASGYVTARRRATVSAKSPEDRRGQRGGGMAVREPGARPPRRLV